MLHEGDVPDTFLAIQFFGKEGRPRDDETPPIGSAGTRQGKRRTSIKRKKLALERKRPNRSTPRQGGVDQDLPRRCENRRKQIGTEQIEVQETPIAFDQRRQFHDSRWVKDVEDNSHSFGILEGKNDSPSPVSNVGTASARG